MGRRFSFAVQCLILSDPTITALAILPAVVWAFVFFVRFSASQLASELRTSFTAETKQQLAAASRSWSFLFLLMYALVLVCTLTWLWLQGTSTHQVWSPTRSMTEQVLRGLYLGLAVAGLLPFLNLFLRDTKRFSFIVFAGASSSRWLRTALVLTLVLAEETWRVVALHALSSDGYSGPTALVISSGIYAVAYLVFGGRPAQGKAISGAVLTGVYLWTLSFTALFCTHLVFEAEGLWLAASTAPSARPGSLARARGSRCPVCKAQVGRSDFRTPVFPCPSCGEKLSIADNRISLVRWGWILTNIPLLLGSFALFPNLQSDKGFWIVLLLVFGVELSLLLLLQSAFPPKLQWGQPNFMGLHLTDHAVKPRVETGSENEHTPPERPST